MKALLRLYHGAITALLRLYQGAIKALLRLYHGAHLGLSLLVGELRTCVSEFAALPPLLPPVAHVAVLVVDLLRGMCISHTHTHTHTHT
jgi:hypothetical protein